jgi:hypothetical protein
MSTAECSGFVKFVAIHSSFVESNSLASGFALDRSLVFAKGMSSLVAKGYSRIVAEKNATVDVYERAVVELTDKTKCRIHDKYPIVIRYGKECVIEDLRKEEAIFVGFKYKGNVTEN